MKRMLIAATMLYPLSLHAQSIPPMDRRVTLQGPMGLESAFTKKADVENGTLTSPTITGGSQTGTQVVSPNISSPTISTATMTGPNVKDQINVPYLAVPDFYVSAEDKAAGNWASALDAAIADVVAHGGGSIRLLPHAYHINGETLNVPANVTVEGASHVAGAVPNNDYRALPYSLLVDPGYTISLAKNTALHRVVVAASNLTLPTTYAEEVAALNQWQSNGTGITIHGVAETQGNEANDVELSDLFIIGFKQAIHTNYAERLRIDNIYGDNQNGLSIDNCHDVCRVRDVHWNSFFNYQSALGGINFPVASISNNGSGAIRLTLVNGTTDLQTGWTLTVWGGNANPGNANGKYVITVVDAKTIDLQGSTYSTSTSGGATSPVTTLYLDTSARTGAGFYVAHSEDVNIYGSFAFGYNIGFVFADGAAWPFVVNSSVDAYLEAHDPDRLGVLVTGTAARMQWTGGYISGTYDPFLFNGTDTLAAHTVMNVSLGATFNSCLNIQGGMVQALGNTCVGGNPIWIGPNVPGISSFVGNQLNNSPVKNLSATYTPIVVDTLSGDTSGLHVYPKRVAKVANLPVCNADYMLGWQVFVQSMRKPNEAAGQGSGGLAVCTADGTTGEYAWYSVFSGSLATD